MLGKLYVSVKEKMSLQMFHGIDGTVEVKDGFELVLRNYANFILNNKDYFLFIEQFTNSPIIDKLFLDKGQSLFNPVFNLFEEGKKKQLFKQISTKLLITYAFIPLDEIAKQHFKNEFELNQENLQLIIQMSWDAVKV
ncbi:TetR/AcrR family transcriptional regulator [Paenibacillus sp. Root444D2]|uniref:TetR/AcrR family transcriptional regulator n=1 Tax=Paenibacillus sp. Root444D2 TaxID=1736538 RepID=UPI001F2ADF4C|nr:TetR/AcrR family transcriptional regulator [Paenibacillus sp. Root444D2]